MIVERFKKGKVKALYERFAEEGRLLPKGVKYLDSWIDERVETCYQLMASRTREDLQKWMINWSEFVEFEVVRVIDSAAATDKVFNKKP